MFFCQTCPNLNRSCFFWIKNWHQSYIVAKDIFWRPPPPGLIKFNVDVVILHDSAKIAVVARYDSGHLFKAWAKRIHTSVPFVAEASAILWAVQLAKMEDLRGIIVESDFKLCGCYWSGQGWLWLEYFCIVSWCYMFSCWIFFL